MRDFEKKVGEFGGVGIAPYDRERAIDGPAHQALKVFKEVHHPIELPMTDVCTPCGPTESASRFASNRQLSPGSSLTLSHPREARAWRPTSDDGLDLLTRPPRRLAGIHCARRHPQQRHLSHRFWSVLLFLERSHHITTLASPRIGIRRQCYFPAHSAHAHRDQQGRARCAF